MAIAGTDLTHELGVRKFLRTTQRGPTLFFVPRRREQTNRSAGADLRKILRVLRDFGFSVDEAILNDLRDPGSIIRMGIPPVRIEMINTISGLSFNEVWERRTSGNYGNVAVNYISYDDLLINKKASGRPKDLADFDELGGNRTT